MSNLVDNASNVNSSWKLILTPSEIERVVKDCANEINQRFIGEDIVIVCLLKGATYFYVDLNRYITIQHTSCFIETKSYENQSQSSLQIISKIDPSIFKDKHVILVDELFDSGNTLCGVKNVLNQEFGISNNMIFSCTAFVKNRHQTHSLPDIFGIFVPDVWLVGYGLDLQQRNRNWTSLYAVPKKEGIPDSLDDQLFTNPEYYTHVRESMKLKCTNE